MTCSICKKEKKKMINIKGMDGLREFDVYDTFDGDVCTECLIKAKGINKLYHATLDPYAEVITPRVPTNRGPEENSTIERICTSTSIEGCLTAVSWGGKCFEFLMAESGSAVIHILEYDIGDIGHKNIIPGDFLWQKGLVHDAFKNDEYWIIRDATPTDSYYIVVTDWTEGWEDFYRYSDYMDYVDGKIEIEDMLDGTFISVNDIEYFKFTERWQCVDEIDIFTELEPVKKEKMTKEKIGAHRRDIEWVFESATIESELLADIDWNGHSFIVDGRLILGNQLYHYDTILSNINESLKRKFFIISDGNKQESIAI